MNNIINWINQNRKALKWVLLGLYYIVTSVLILAGIGILHVLVQANSSWAIFVLLGISGYLAHRALIGGKKLVGMAKNSIQDQIKSEAKKVAQTTQAE